MMGYEPQALPEVIETAWLPAVEEQLKSLKEATNEALAVHKLTQELMKNWIKSKFTPFKVNNKVWLEAQNHKETSLTLNSLQNEKDPSK